MISVYCVDGPLASHTYFFNQKPVSTLYTFERPGGSKTYCWTLEQHAPLITGFNVTGKYLLQEEGEKLHAYWQGVNDVPITT